MHELSIAQSIVQLSEQQAREHHSSQIEEVELEIGRLAGVELQTLEFAMESAVKGTLLEKAKIIRRYIDLLIFLILIIKYWKQNHTN